MWQRFTERARRVVFFAQEEAWRLGESTVEPLHVLLGLLREEDNMASRILKQMSISPADVRAEIERLVTPGDVKDTQNVELTRSAKRIIDLAYDEARLLSNNYIGTEHLLLGIISEGGRFAGGVLAKCGAGLDSAREEARKLQLSDTATPSSSTSAEIGRGAQPSAQTDSAKGRSNLWSRFTERARRAVFFAQEEAGRLGNNYVETEHLLLGLLRENDSIAHRILDSMGFESSEIVSELRRLATRGDGRLGQDMQLTPRTKRVLDLSHDEARTLHNDYVGTEHLLLGLIREAEGLAGRVLAKTGVDLERTRQVVRDLQTGDAGMKPVPNAKRTEPEGIRPSDPTIEKDPPDMWIRFTARARSIIFSAEKAATKYGQNYVGTEHILFGLTSERDNVASIILGRMGVSIESLVTELERLTEQGSGTTFDALQLTPRAKRVIDLAYYEARRLYNNYIGTEHLLLGLVREGEGLAGRLLAKLGVELERVRAEILALQDNDAGMPTQPKRTTYLNAQSRSVRMAVLDCLAQIEVNDQIRDATLDGAMALCEGSEWIARSLVTLADVSQSEIRVALNAAKALSLLHRNHNTMVSWSYPRTLGMIFEKPSLRTRVSFEAGMAHLGGHAIYLAPGDIGLGTRESIPDVALALSRWVDVISARVFKHETVEELAKYATVPVINALSDREHPVQAFADLLTLEEHMGPLGNNLKMAYIGDGNNVLHALLLACAKMGVNLSAACPEGYFPDAEYVDMAREAAKATGASIDVITDPKAAAADADALYTDVWTSMGQEEETVARRAIFAPYQINAELVSAAKPDAIVMHCLPAHCGEEISEEVYEKHRQVIMDQAENRMHTQKALIVLMIGI